jgi:hypothetical protein
MVKMTRVIKATSEIKILRPIGGVAEVEEEEGESKAEAEAGRL